MTDLNHMEENQNNFNILDGNYFKKDVFSDQDHQDMLIISHENLNGTFKN